MRQLLEHESKAIARRAGLSVPPGTVVRTAAEARAAAHHLGPRVAVKAQVPTGSRGKSGGILIGSASQVETAAESLLGGLVGGFLVEELLIESAVEALYEFYLAVAVDRRRATPVLLVGAAGGVDVETSRENIASVPLGMCLGVRPWHVRLAAEDAGVTPELVSALIEPAICVWEIYRDTGADLVEVNPLSYMAHGDVTAVDVRIISRRLESGYPHRPISDEIKRDYGFDLVELDADGCVGLITTGAGASMMLVDMLVAREAPPVNFCDIRAGGLRGDPTRIELCLEVLDGYPNLRAIGINVFAGFTDLSEFADLMAASLRAAQPRVPVVARLEGDGRHEARELLAAAGAICVGSFDELVDELVSLTKASTKKQSVQ